MPQLAKFRPYFPDAARVTYLRAHVAGAIPAPRGAAPEGERLAAEVRERLAALVGLPAGELWLCPGVAGPAALFLAGHSAVATTPGGDTSLLALLRGLHPARSWELLPEGGALRPGLGAVWCTPVRPYDGALLDVAAVCARASAAGAEVILDVRGWVGALPFSLPTPAPALVLGWVQSWLCGGPGLSFVWARPDVAARLRETLGGASWPEPVHPAALAAAREGLRVVEEAGVERIREKSQRLTRRILEGVLARGFGSPTPRDAEARGGVVAVVTPHAEAVARALYDHHIWVEYHPSAGIGVAPHLYNNETEIDRFLSTLDEVIDRREYERFVRPRAALP